MEIFFISQLLKYVTWLNGIGRTGDNLISRNNSKKK